MSADGAAIQPTLSLDDQRRLLEFLRALRGGKTKVVITSRSSEEWLEPATCFRFAIGGLQGEERWEYCDAVVRDLGLTVDRTNADWVKLMDLLDGHPLTMRVILSHLQTSSVAQLMASLETNLLQFAGQDAESAKLFATLRFVQDGLSIDLQRLLIPLALHDRFVDADYLKVMGKQVNEPVSEADVDRLTRTLSTAGLLSDRGQAMFEMHPALSRYLQSTLLLRNSGIENRSRLTRNRGTNTARPAAITSWGSSPRSRDSMKRLADGASRPSACFSDPMLTVRGSLSMVL